jgi:hypothetical protein
MPQRWANSISLKAILSILEAKNQKREAERLRSMLRTAYNNHIESKTKSTVPRERRRKSLVQVNPLQHITAIPGAIQARRRSLTSLELGFFMLCLDLVPSATSRALQLVVWLGGQRLAQVLRAMTEDLDEDCESLMLWDPKGKRTQARAHLVPLVGPAKDLIKIGESHAKERDTPYLFTTSGRKVLSADAVSDLLLSIKLEILTRGVIRKDFDVRDIRRIFETYLASKKLDDKARAHLFSHGIGGVQDEHYRSGPACLHSFTPRDKETASGLKRCRVVHGGGRRLRRSGRRCGQLGAHQGFPF